jgi:hypothetical protein
MNRLLAWLGGALGLAALWRFLRQEQAQQQQQRVPASDPAAELRARLEQAREAPDDRDEFDAAEGQPVDEIEHARSAAATEPEPDVAPEPEPPRSLEERRRAIHEKAQQALGEMHRPEADE